LLVGPWGLLVEGCGASVAAAWPRNPLARPGAALRRTEGKKSKTIALDCAGIC